MKSIIISLMIIFASSVYAQGLEWGPDTYEAKVYRVVDGDTAYLSVSLGFGITKDVKVRLRGIDAPEIRGVERPEGLKSKKALSDMIGGKEVILMTKKTGKYGRWIGTIYLSNIDINLWMVRVGHAVESK